jgi:UDP-glucose:(heptosyl)LPS alpha-1,3-glucosyltransferase
MERMGHALIQELYRDVDFTVVAAEGLDALPPSVARRPVRLVTAPAPLRIAQFWHRAARLVTPGPSDLVHTCGAILPVRVDLSSVHLVQHTAQPSRPRSPLRRVNSRVARALGRHYESLAFRPGRVRRLVAVSSGVAGDLAMVVPELPVTVITNGIDVERWRQEPVRSAATPLHVALVTGDFALKRVDLLLEALALAPEVTATVAGAGAIADYRRCAEAKGVGDRVHFCGPVTDLRELYATADAIAVLSDYESFGLTMVEAALAGCAVVARPVGVAARLIGSGDGGALVDDDPRHVAAVFNRWRDDRPAVWAAGRVARGRAEAFDQATMASAYLSLYRELASR